MLRIEPPEDLVGQLLIPSGQGLGVAVAQFGWPSVPAGPVEMVTQGAKAGIIQEPVPLVLTKSFKLLPPLRRGVGSEIGRRFAQQLFLVMCHPAVIDPVRICRFRQRDIVLIQIAQADQFTQVDQQGVAGKGREGVVGRIAVAGGIKRQDLPDALAGFCQKVHELKSFFSQGPDAVRAGQAGGMQQNAVAAGDLHKFSPENDPFPPAEISNGRREGKGGCPNVGNAQLSCSL